MERKVLARRYRYLWMGEAINILVFIVLFLYHALIDEEWSNWIAHWIARTYSLTVVIIILLQGVIWWRWKLCTLQAGQRTMPLRILIRFRRFKWVNWLLIGLFPVVLCLKWWLTDSFWLSNDTWLGLLFMGGAFLEQINYYYYQLMYDNRYDWTWLRAHRRLRQGSIGKALAQMSE